MNRRVRGCGRLQEAKRSKVVAVVRFVVNILLLQICRGEPSNVALGKTAYQVSNYGSSLAERAVDGDPNPDFNQHSCAMTHAAPNPWWVLDLEAIYSLRSATIVNRNSYMARLSNVHVGVTAVSPLEQPPVLGAYDVCAYHAGAVGAVWDTTLSCRAGRYVVVQLASASEYLTMCEVTIMGERGQTTFDCVKDRELENHVISEQPARHVIECAKLCFEDAQCRSVNYQEGVCVLNRERATTVTELTVSGGTKYCD